MNKQGFTKEQAKRHLEFCAALKKRIRKLEEEAGELEDIIGTHSNIDEAAAIYYDTDSDEGIDKFYKEFLGQ